MVSLNQREIYIIQLASRLPLIFHKQRRTFVVSILCDANPSAASLQLTTIYPDSAITQDVGMRSTMEMHKALEDGTLRLELRSPAAQREGGVHSLYSFEKLSK